MDNVSQSGSVWLITKQPSADRINSRLFLDSLFSNINRRFSLVSVYLLKKDMLSWYDVQNACEEKSMHLPSIHSDKENERIKNLFPRVPLVFIGLKKRGGEWVWSDGSKYDYHNWGWYIYDDCVFIDKQSGKWNTFPCSRDLTFFYICATVKSGTAD